MEQRVRPVTIQRGGLNGEGPRRPRAVAVVPEAPAHDLDVEREVLHTCLEYPEQIDGAGLTRADFFSDQHGVVWEELSRMRRAGAAIDGQRLRSALKDSGALGADAIEYIASITAGLPTAGAPQFARLRKLARMRDVQQRAAHLVVVARTGEDVVDAYGALERAKRALDECERPADLPDLADFVAGLEFDGRRLSTGMPTLDQALRGGLPLRKLVVVLGAPGASKTTFATWLCNLFEQQGAASLYLASDEARSGIVVRLGQIAGFERAAMESPHKTARLEFAEQLRSRPRLRVIDPARDLITIEDAERRLIKRFPDCPRVIVVDSLQTVPTERAPFDDSQRARIEAVLASCQDIADRGTTVIAISEMNRGSYRTGSSALDGDALAGGKDSGRIEYSCDLLMSLSEVKSEKGVVHCAIKKNRISGEKPALRFQINFARATVHEISLPPETLSIDRESEKSRLRLEGGKKRVREAVKKHRDLKSQRDVLAVAGGSRSANADAFHDLMRTGELALVDGVLRLQPRPS